MKKISLLISLLSITACVATTTSSPVAPTPTLQQQEQQNKENILKDQQRHQQDDSVETEKEQATKKEQANWEKSVERIQNALDKNTLDYNICVSVSGKTSRSCISMLNKICERSIYIDTRGGHMEDPLCSDRN